MADAAISQACGNCAPQSAFYGLNLPGRGFIRAIISISLF
jgi:hypothetical protein